MNEENKIFLSYRWTLDAYRVLWQIRKNFTYWSKIAHSLVWSVIAIFGLIGVVEGSTDLIGFAILYAVIWILITTVGQKWVIKKRFKQLRLDLHELQLEVSDRGLQVTAGASNSFTDWGEFRRFDETESYFLLWLNRLTGVVIPKIAFASDRDISAFAVLAREKTSNSSF